jgi:Ca2+-binding RTX toxin-like protein
VPIVTFGNATAIAMGDGGDFDGNLPGTTTPFPSQIVASGLAGVITDIDVELFGFNHTYLSDLTARLVGPGGTTVFLFEGDGDSKDVTGNYVFDDDAPTSITSTPAGTSITAGSYRPQGDLNAFNGMSANGTWQFFIQDFFLDDTGAVNGGWQISFTIDLAPTAVVLSNIHGPIAENASTSVHTKVADIAITDPDGGANFLSLSGLDAALFEIVGNALFLRAGAHLDFETNPLLDVTVNVDNTPGGPVDASASLAIAIGNIAEAIIGTAVANTLIGTNNGETLSGLGGNDRIVGLGGNDRIVGGAGVDVMTGGPGNDVFVFNSITESGYGQSGLINASSYGAAAGQGKRDVITDFTHGQDKLDLSAIDANSKLAGNQAFTWHGTGNLAAGKPGWLIERIYNPAGTAFDKTIIYGDINGDARADFQIELTGLKTITVSDFIL